jgi:hypothetical protein
MVTDRDVSGQQVPHSPGRAVVDLHDAFLYKRCRKLDRPPAAYANGKGGAAERRDN